MDATSFRGQVVSNLPLLIFASVAVHLCLSYFKRGLHRYPGPLLAKFTNLWFRFDVKANRHHHNLIALHQRYGDVVRIGPNKLSISSPEYVPLVFGSTNRLLKSDMYDPFSPRVNGKAMVYWMSTKEPSAHEAIRKPVGGAFSVATTLKYEPLIDEMITKLVDILDRDLSDGKNNNCDMGLWLRLFAMDMIMHLTFSETLGFLDAGKDIDDFMLSLDQALDQIALLITMPWTGSLLKYNRLVEFFEQENSMFVAWTSKQIQKRIGKATEKHKEDPSSETPSMDLFDRFFAAAQIDASPGYDIPLVMNWTITSIQAGADTIATALKSIMYFMVKSPSKQRILVKELQAANLSYPVSWKESQKLPYLDACIKEAFRLHPVTGMGLERVVGSTGIPMPDGYTVPKGTKVSMNAWALSRQTIYGDDADEFIPERWLQQADESVQEHEARVGLMKRADLNFGAGKHACVGKYIAFLEIYKIIPTLFLKFDFGLADEAREWVTINRFVVRQTNIRCWLRRRG